MAGAGVIGLDLLVGADAFWRRAREDMAVARRRLFVQAMTFEGDAAGLPVARAVIASRAVDRRVLVDDYSRHVVNDRSVRGRRARADPALRAEVAATERMWDDLVASGAPVRLTNPVGRLGLNYPARNHKKLIVADDVAWIGGINFSDHNFAWRDFMLRIDGAAASDALAEDFAATFAGAPAPWRADLGGLTLISLDGRANPAGFAPILALVAAARAQVTVVSPYLTQPFTGALAHAARRGVSVRLITPAANNKPLVQAALLRAAARAGFEVRLTPGMSHLKALLVDDARLVMGSSNFDFVSWAAEEELAAIVSDPALIADFRRRIVEPALAQAPPDATRPPLLSGLAAAALRIAALAIAPLRHAPRGAVDWLPSHGEPT